MDNQHTEAAGPMRWDQIEREVDFLSRYDDDPTTDDKAGVSETTGWAIDELEDASRSLAEHYGVSAEAMFVWIAGTVAARFGYTGIIITDEAPHAEAKS